MGAKNICVLEFPLSPPLMEDWAFMVSEICSPVRKLFKDGHYVFMSEPVHLQAEANVVSKAKAKVPTVT